MSTPKGYTSQDKEDRLKPQHSTISPVRRQQNAEDIVSHNSVQTIASDAAEAGSTTQVINATAHSARRGDVIRITSGAHNKTEVSVYAVTANAIELAETLPSAVAAAVTFDILRYTRLSVNSDGEIVLAPGGSSDISYMRDGVSTTVTHDTVTPANNRPLPVQITDYQGQITLNAANLDVNVQLSDAGANADKVKIGDGTDTLGINADGSIVSRVSDGTDSLGINADGSIISRVSDGTDTLGINADGSVVSRISDGTDSLDVKADGAIGVWAKDGTGNALTSQVSGAQRALDVGVNVAGVQVDPRSIRQLVATGGSPDTVRVSDGTDSLAINADGSVPITDNGGSLTVDSPQLPAALGQTTAANSLSVVLASNNGTVTTSQVLTSATLQARGKISGTALTGSYATILTTASNFKILYLFNTCDQTIFVSLDNGTTDHFELESGESVTVDFAANDIVLASGSVVRAKHAGVVPTSGSIRASGAY